MMNPFKQVNWQPGPAELRTFSRSLMIGFPIIAALLGAMRWIRTAAVPEWIVWLGATGFAIGVITRLIPRLAPPFYLLWHAVTCTIGLIVTNAIVASIYYLVITPVGLLLRATGRDPMERKMLPKGTTYWEDAAKPEGPERYFRQY